ncbi:glycosyltransferase [Clostridium thermarum]|uniref:glycosyltransferase n=1 Tax=Clostridium thermarum TaxID=1716543 RepID=UPI0013D293EE|nr:glycosyltransferase family 2 protein [Clostridium thermarum]
MQNKENSTTEVSIICPLYNAENYIEKLYRNILRQKGVDNVEILYVLTESSDGTEALLRKMGVDYVKIQPEEFSHSKTREWMAYRAKGEILVFITQDIQIINDNWLINLIRPIQMGECEASFSRQICDENIMEKYIREKNYPKESRIVSKKDIPEYGLMTFFYSDASSAIKASVFRELNGYDGKNLIINEDMYIASKLIDKGYRIKYCSNSEVVHYHIFTLKQIFSRYFDTGVFFKENPEFSDFKTSDSGFSIAKYVITQAIKEGNIKAAVQAIPNFASRLAGSYLGKRYKNLSMEKRIKYSSNKAYWKNIQKEEK